MAATDGERKRQIREFQRNAQRLLTEDDRECLHDIMKDYQAYKSVEKLIDSLKSCLDSPRKLDLLSDIRNLVPAAQLGKFDSLAPYHKMAHPYKPNKQTSPDRKTQSLTLRNGHLNQNGRISPSGGSLKVISLNRASLDQVLGFSLQGGQEQGIHVYVSEVDSGSQAFKQGVCVGDRIIEVNGIDFDHIALNSAVSLLSSLKKIKLVLKSGGKLPEVKATSTPRRNPWGERNGSSPDGYDLNSSSSSDGHAGITLQANSHLLNSDDKRRVNLVVESTPTGFIGFTLRGGAEYGLGIYISGVDPGSLAEEAGFHVGDQILNINGKNFENIKHKEAVDFIKSNKHIIVTLKAVGKLPEAKHYTSEISWIYPDGSIVKEGKEMFSRSLSAPPPSISPSETFSAQFNSPELNNNTTQTKPESRECGVQTPDASPRIETNAQAPDVIVAQDNLARTQSVATSISTSSGDDIEKRHSGYSSTHSVDSGNSRDDAEKKYLSTSSVRSGDYAHLQSAPASDSEVGNEESKKKVKKSKSFLQKHGDKIKSKLSFRKKSKPKVEAKTGGPTKQQLLLYVEERAKKILVVEEYNAILSDIKQYLEDSDVELLVNKLLAILDKPEKALLLRDVRTLISPYDLGRFDAMVSAHEKDALEYLSVCVPGSPTSILPTQVEKPKRQLISVIQDSRGGFQIRSKEELEKLKQEREAQAEMTAAQRAWLGGNILDRQARLGTSEYYAVRSTTPEAIEMIPVHDTGPSQNIANHEQSSSSQPNTAPVLLSVPVIQVNNDNSNEEDIPMETMSSPNTLAVPDRVSVEYKDDEETEKSAFFSLPSTSSGMPTVEEGVLILLPKNRTSLGISISGGKGSKMQPEIRVEKIFPGGAAHDDGRLKSGDEIISVDGSSMRDVTHAEAVDIIRRSYNNKTKGVMEITVIPKQ